MDPRSILKLKTKYRIKFLLCNLLTRAKELGPAANGKPDLLNLSYTTHVKIKLLKTPFKTSVYFSETLSGSSKNFTYWVDFLRKSEIGSIRKKPNCGNHT